MDEQKFINRLYDDHVHTDRIPSPEAVCGWLDGLLSILFPELSNRRFNSRREFEQYYTQLKIELYSLLKTMADMLPSAPDYIENKFLEQLPEVYRMLNMDADAILKGDPAAVSRTEVIRTYPGFKAIAVYRIAHEFIKQGIPLIPRILTEHIHGSTGIDIHPSANIGESFCIDHGTGIVIGETVEIGDNVKIYQGVTLGALSVRKTDAQVKRHPTIEDNVVIYSGATILGGETTIGHSSIIGGNVWLTRSVPAYSRVYYEGITNQKLKLSNSKR
jgi:serine O-acetyltransferase